MRFILQWFSAGQPRRRKSSRSSLRFRPTLEALEPRTTPATLLSGFTESVVADGISNGTAMELAPNGDLWVLQQGGAVKRFVSGSTVGDTIANVADLGLRTEGERGLLGIAFDPGYASNKFVYLYYTSSDAPNPHNRVSRFTVNDANSADYSFVDTDAGVAGPDETVILDLDALSGATNHNGGAIHFGPDGKLYVAVGDNANGSHAQTIANRHGKILRINADGTIPSDNPTSIAGIAGTTSGANRAIWAAGLRNPYTFAFDPDSGRMFINDVGQNTWEEVNEGGAGRNFGWPGTEGDFSQASQPNFTRPVYAYSHGGGTFQGFAITGGAFYSPDTASFPPEYAGDYFFADYVNDWINVMDADGTNVRRFASNAPATVDLRVGDDGSLYYLARDSSKVFRIAYTASTAPAITQQPTDATASTGGTASFSVAASGTAPLSYRWQTLVASTWTDLADGVGVSGSGTATLTLTGVDAADAGQYRVRVSNSAGTAISNAATLTVTANQAPSATLSITSGLTNGKFTAGQVVGFSGTATDPEDGTLSASAFTWKVEYITSIASGNPVVRPFVPEFSGVTSGTFTPATTGPYTLSDVAYRVTLMVRDSAGLVTTRTVDISPNVSTITLQSSPAGLTLTVDGQPYTTPTSFSSVVGFERPIGAAASQTLGSTPYVFRSWSDGGAATHTISTPSVDTTYTAAYDPLTAGLRAEFFDFTSSLSTLPNLSGVTPTVTRTDATLNYASTSSAWTGLDSRFADTFATRHTGYVRVDTAGSYTFYLNSDDGSKVWLNGELIINNDGLHAMRELSATRTLSAGYHSLRVEYFENGGGAGLILSWAGPSITKQVIPAGRLYQVDTGSPERTESGTASASSQPVAVEQAPKAFDNLSSTKWLGNTNSAGGGAWVAYTFGGTSAVAVDRYAITSANDVPGRDPKDWRLQGSNDGVNWVTLDTRTGQAFANRFERREFTFANAIAFRSYRLLVDANNGSRETATGGAGIVQLAELQLYGTPATLANRATGGVAAASTQPVGGSGAAQAFDGNAATKWVGDVAGAWLQYQFAGSSAFAIREYRVTSANDVPGRDPKSWRLLGSTDGVNWVLLDTRVDQVFSGRGVTNSYAVTVGVAYRYYRLQVDAIAGAEASVQVGELGLLG